MKRNRIDRGFTLIELPAVSKRKASGFTLVELLVVIGIIAVLISVLLPALNKARQQANLVACQANLKQMGSLFQVYAAENKGFMPYGEANVWVRQVGNLKFYTPFNSATGGTWNWWDTLSIMSHKQRSPVNSNRAAYFSGIFRDLDTIESAQGARDDTVFGLSHYMGNIRALVMIDAGGGRPSPQDWTTGDATTATWYPQCKLKSIRPASGVMIVWDGAQYTAGVSGFMPIGGTRPTCRAMDNWSSLWGHQYLNPPAQDSGQWTSQEAYQKPIDPSGNAGEWERTATAQKLHNSDMPANDSWADYRSIRFRHMNNTTGNFLFGDGHVEMRKAGTVLVKDVCMKRGG